ncbi:MAG: glycosyltransferase, partial [Polyangiaceae bacterium]|nr:glycosyltransferase [Polyangiaceae bacterium]
DGPAIRSVRELVRAYDPDVVHGAVFEGVVMATLASLGRRARVVVEEIDYPITRSRRAQLLFSVLARSADRCVAVSPAVREYLVEEGGVPDRKITLIPNGVERPVLPDAEGVAALRAEVGIPEDAFVVGSLGRLVDEHKRFSDLLRATAALRDELPSLHLLIAGEGPDREALEALADALGIAQRVSFAGYRADVGAMYALMDVFALVSNRESFGLVLAEAMYVGLPVVCTGIGGMRDVVLDGETGLYVGLGDVDAIARALARLAREPALREALGAKGRERAERLFSAERYSADVAALYEELLAR